VDGYSLPEPLGKNPFDGRWGEPHVIIIAEVKIPPLPGILPSYLNNTYAFKL
jgi:hypothetical protein